MTCGVKTCRQEQDGLVHMLRHRNTAAVVQPRWAGISQQPLVPPSFVRLLKESFHLVLESRRDVDLVDLVGQDVDLVIWCGSSDPQ